MILNGVCVIWRGWIDLHRLDGMGCLEYDDERAQVRPLNMPQHLLRDNDLTFSEAVCHFFFALTWCDVPCLGACVRVCM